MSHPANEPATQPAGVSAVGRDAASGTSAAPTSRVPAGVVVRNGRHNLGTVIAFEFLRTVRKPRFWIISLAVPIFMGMVAALVSYSSTSRNTQASATSPFTFSYHDASGMVDPQIATQMGGTAVTDAAAAVDAVKAGTLTAFFDIPATPATQPVRVYAKDVGLMSNSKYSETAKALVQASLAKKIGSPQTLQLAAGQFATTTTTYANGKVAPGFTSVILPGMFVVLFYMSVVMLGNQMLNVTLEEKENRVSEMILTTMNPTTLITGKVLALMLIGILQSLIFSLPVMVGWWLAPTLFHRPDLSLSNLSVDPVRIVMGFLLFVVGFAMFAGMLVAVGAVMPSAKEAGQVFGPLMIALFVPLYAMTLILNQPHGVVSTIFTYFPLTAPITALVRNATGSLSVWEGLIVLLVVGVFAAIMLRLGVRLFHTGSISYDSKVNIRTALRLSKA